MAPSSPQDLSPIYFPNSSSITASHLGCSETHKGAIFPSWPRAFLVLALKFHVSRTPSILGKQGWMATLPQVCFLFSDMQSGFFAWDILLPDASLAHFF